MSTKIAGIIFWTALFAAGLCASTAALVLSMSLPGAAFPPPNSIVILSTAATTLAGAAFALLKLLTGEWLPASQEEQTEAFDGDYAYYRSEDLELARDEQRDAEDRDRDNDRYNEDDRDSETQRYDEDERENPRLTDRRADRLMPF